MSCRICGTQMSISAQNMQRRQDVQKCDSQWSLHNFGPRQQFIPSLLQLWSWDGFRVDFDPVICSEKQRYVCVQAILPARHANQPRCAWMEKLSPVNVPYEVHREFVHSLASHLQLSDSWGGLSRLYPHFAGLSGFACSARWSHLVWMVWICPDQGNWMQNCTAFTVYGEVFEFHIDSWATDPVSCDFNGQDGEVHSEDNFGYYENTNPAFRCSSSPESTTQYWFGSR